MICFSETSAQTWTSSGSSLYANPTSTNIGIGTTNPNSKIHINASSGQDGLRVQLSGSTRLYLHNNGGLAIGNNVTPPARGLYIYDKLAVGTSSPVSWAKVDIRSTSSEAYLRLIGTGTASNNFSGINLSSDESVDKQWEIIHRKTPLNALIFAHHDGTQWVQSPLVLRSSGDIGIGTDTPQSKLHINGTTTTKVLEITGGADIAESFTVNSSHKVTTGMVVSIDSINEGQLKLSDNEYDRKVVGIISGANNIKSGLILNQKGTIADGEFPVALTGRVYCFADGFYGEIKPGDFLTTSNTPGYAMVVSDLEKANGAIIGKAMTSLQKDEKGLVLVLITLK